MSIQLDPRYQVEAYNRIKDSLEKTKKAGVIMPPSAGKTYLALKLIEDSLASNKQILYVSPSPKINVQVRKIIRANYSQEEAKQILSKVKFVTYHALQRRFKEHKEDMVEYNSDTIIFDEVHRSGAQEWGKAVDYLLENNKEANVLGMTATPLRNDGQDMIDIRCGGVAYELKVSEAVARGILKLPIYISARHISNDDIVSMEEKLELVDDEKERKKLENQLRIIRKQVQNGQNISEVYKKHLQPDEKYIVFNNPGDDLEKLQEQAKKEGTFNGVNEKQKYYIIESSRGEVENQVALDGFERNEKGVLKLLYVKNMLSEGYHHEKLAGEIMARPTKSYIFFVQILGRILTREEKETPPVVLDLVGNIRYFKEFRLEVRRIIEEGIKRGETVYDERVLESFRILDEQEEFVKAFEKIEEEVDSYLAKNALKNLKKIEAWCKKNFESEELWNRRLPTSKAKDKEEKRLGEMLGTIRKRLKQYEGTDLEAVEDEEDRRLLERLRNLDEEYAYGRRQLHENLGNLLEIEAWCKKNFEGEELWNRRLPSSSSKDEEEKRLGKMLGTLRRRLKQYEGTDLEKVEDEEDRRLLEKLRNLDEQYAYGHGQLHGILGNLLEIEAWCKKTFEGEELWNRRLPRAESKDEEEKRIGTMLKKFRQKLKQYEGQKIEEVDDEEDRRLLEKLRNLYEKYAYGDNQLHESLGNLLEIETWCKKNFEDEDIWNRRVPSSSSKEEEEKRLGKMLENLRKRLKQYEGTDLEEVEDEEDRRLLEKLRNLDEQYAYGEYQLHGSLGNLLEIEAWCKKNFEGKELWNRRLPRAESKDEEEKKLGKMLSTLRTRLKQYEGTDLEEVEDEEDRKLLEKLRNLDEEYAYGHMQLHESLGNLLEIEAWCKKNFAGKELWNRRLPSVEAKNKEEKRLGEMLGTLRKRLKQYEGIDLEEVEDEEDRRLLEKLRNLDEQYAYGNCQLHGILGKLLEIEAWCKKNFEGEELWNRRLPSKESENEEEKRLGKMLGNLRKRLKQYEGTDLEEVEDEEDRRLLEKLRNLDEQYAYGNCQLHGILGKLLEIEAWCKKNFEGEELWDRRLPSSKSKDEEEKRLGKMLGNLRQKLKQYEGTDLEEVEDAEDRRLLEKLRNLDEEYNPRKLKKTNLQQARGERDQAKATNEEAKKLEEQVSHELPKGEKGYEE